MRSMGPVRKIPASVYRSGARANQTDIIDLTCDLEIRKITDGERLEPIIIVNIGRPSFAAAAAATAAQASYISKVWRPYSQQLRPLSFPSFLFLGPSSFIYVSSFPPSTFCFLFLFSTQFALSIFGYLPPVRRPFCVQSFYLY